MHTPIPNPAHPDTRVEHGFVALVDYLSNLCQEFKLVDISEHCSFDSDARAQPGDTAAGPPTSSIVIDPLPPSHKGFPFGGEFTSTFVCTPVRDATRTWKTEEQNDLALEHDSPLSQYLTGKNGNCQVPWHSPISPSAAVGPLTSLTTTTPPSAQSPVAPSTAVLHVAADDAIRTVGSPQIQQAAARRRKKDGAYQCALGNCNQTFTEFHNLQYHINSHLDLRPYECTKCSYTAASPATLKRHMKRHPSR